MRIYYKITCYPMSNAIKIAFSVAVSSMIAHSDFYQKNIDSNDITIEYGKSPLFNWIHNFTLLPDYKRPALILITKSILLNLTG